MTSSMPPKSPRRSGPRRSTTGEKPGTASLKAANNSGGHGNKSSSNQQNRRRHARAGLPATVILFQGRKPHGPCVVEDMSEGGLRVVSDEKIARGKIVSVLSDLPGTAALLAFAQVAHCETRRSREYVLGLAFVDLARSEEKRLHDLVARVLAETEPTVDFFDTDGTGEGKRLVLAEGKPLVTPGLVKRTR